MDHGYSYTFAEDVFKWSLRFADNLALGGELGERVRR